MLSIFRIFFPSALLILTLGGCSERGAYQMHPDDDIEALVFEPIGRGNYAAVEDTARLVFRSEAEWTAFRDRLRPIRDFGPVDFNQMMVVVAAVPTTEGGHSVEFESFEVDRRGVLASYVIQEPGEDCMTATVISQPFQAVKVRRHDADVRFEHRVETYRCRLGRRR
jgi:hypothetical protein